MKSKGNVFQNPIEKGKKGYSIDLSSTFWALMFKFHKLKAQFLPFNSSKLVIKFIGAKPFTTL